MLSNFTGKGIALGCGAFIGAGFMAMSVETTKALLFEIRNSRAAQEAAVAQVKAAEAKQLEAINMLKGTLETAQAMTNVGRLQAHATEAAAQHLATATENAAKTSTEGLIAASNITSHPENETFDRLTSGLLPPATETASLNRRITRLKRETESGIDSKSRRHLSESERADRKIQQENLEEELVILNESASKNASDTVHFMLEAVGKGLGNLGSLYEVPKNSTPTTRRIVQEP